LKNLDRAVKFFSDLDETDADVFLLENVLGLDNHVADARLGFVATRREACQERTKARASDVNRSPGHRLVELSVWVLRGVLNPAREEHEPARALDGEESERPVERDPDHAHHVLRRGSKRRRPPTDGSTAHQPAAWRVLSEAATPTEGGGYTDAARRP
jgi:hypothetical protein